jgi:hypothetical protein
VVPNSPPPARRTLAVAYLLLAAAGVVSLIWPTSVGQAGRGPADVWSTFLAVGGLSCALGVARHTWFAEWAALPLIVAAWAAFAVSALTGHTRSVAVVLASLGVAATMTARWVLLNVYRHAARDEARRRGRR